MRRVHNGRGHVRRRLARVLATLVLTSGLPVAVLAAAALTGSALHPSARALAAAPGWTSSPADVAPGSPPPTAISCPTSTFCMAVDSGGDALSWNGTSWSTPQVIDAGNGGLTGVSCPDSSTCVAVDNSGYALRWSAGSWGAVQVAGQLGNPLDAVSCATATMCVAVGALGDAATYNGASWSAAANVDGGRELAGVSCPLSAFCMAVDDNGFAVEMNAGSWASPVQAGDYLAFSGIACPSDATCVAVGINGDAAVWSAGTWGPLATVDTAANGLGSVTCSGGSTCLAADQAGNVLTWNGASWSGLLPVDPLGGGIQAISCAAGTPVACGALDASGDAFELDGPRSSAPQRADPGAQAVSALSCPSTTSCIAGDGAGNVLTWNGASWSAPAPVDAGGNGITSISCPSTGFCAAVDAAGDVLFGSGTSWAAPQAIDASSAGLTGVSCTSAAMCLAVDGSGNALEWDGTSWSAPAPVDTAESGFTGVSCGSTTWCVAVDFAGDAYTWNGSGWSAALRVDRRPTESGVSGTTAVSCPSALFCVAVDAAGDAATFSGGAWAAPQRVSAAPIDSVSCAAPADCTAIDSAGNVMQLTGTVWSVPQRVDASGGSPLDVSCTGGTLCAAGDTSGELSVYEGPPVVTGVAPSTGPLAGGNTVVISGSGFAGATAVRFGSVAAEAFAVHDDHTITAAVPAGAAPGVVAVTLTGPSGVSGATEASGYLYANPGPLHTESPVRIVDTRRGAMDPATFAGDTLGPGARLDIPVVGANGDGVPAAASAAVLNITAVNPSAWSYLTVWPGGVARPEASSLNFTAGEAAVAGMVEVPLGAGGDVSVFNAFGRIDVLVDVEGWVGPATTTAGLFHAAGPVRIADTRSYPTNTYQGAGAKLGPGGSLAVRIEGAGGLPGTGISAVVVNVTATGGTAAGGYLTAYPDGGAPPGASTVNFAPGATVPNRAVVALGAGGAIRVYNALGSTDVIVDVTGWFTDATASGGALFHPVSPARIADTRSYAGNDHQDAGVTIRPSVFGSADVAVAGYDADGVPAGSAAVGLVANVTVTDTSTTGGYLTVWPAGAASLPSSSDLNWTAGETVANAVVVAIGSGGAVTLTASNSSTDAIVDVDGWYG